MDSACVRAVRRDELDSVQAVSLESLHQLVDNDKRAQQASRLWRTN